MTTPVREVCPLMHELIERQCDRTPEREAVVCGDVVLTYRRLDERASRLATVLRQRGVTAESRVALRLIDRSADAIVAILGVMKAGGAYVPLDPATPKERLDFMLADSGALVVIEDELLADVDAAEPLPRNAVRMDAQSLAYVIYTSGSTGRPKGVLVPHAPLVNYTEALVRRMNLPAGTRYANVSTLAADLGHTMIFPPLVSGGSVHLLPTRATMDAELFADAFTRARIDCLKIVPSHLATLLATAREPQRVLPRELLVLGGEAARPALLQRIRSLAPSLRILNHYGPTETTVGVLTHDVTGEEAFLGFPIDNATTQIVDGELFVGGAPLARGYHNRPDQTAERFVPDTEGARLYRTGDLVRRRNDGALEFLGRADHQVKIRGYRVELGEVEAALLAHPDVHGAIVEKRGEELAALVAGEVPVNELRVFVRARLPEYMVPASITVREMLPLTANGKVDRDAVALTTMVGGGPSPRLRGEGGAQRRVRGIAEIISTLLGKPVGVDDNLLDFGAHSLLMMRAAAQICAAFDVSIDVATMFAAPRVSAIARAVEAATPVVEVFEEAAGPELSLGQLRMWIVRQLAADPALYNIATVVRLRRPVAIEELERALTTLVARHDALRTVVREDGTAFVESNAAVRVEGGTDIREEVRKPFDLSRAPLLRAALVGDALVITTHHIASDAWSTRILLRELAALLRGETLAETGAPYAEFAAWQRRWLASTDAAASLAFWRERLAGIEGTLEIPADRPRPAVQSGRGGTHRFELDADVLARVTELAHEEGATPYMVLLAVFQLLLHKITRQRDVVVGSPIAGRDNARFETTAGFFVNTIVQRTRIEMGESFRKLLRRVREGCMSAYAHGRMPFDRIVEELRPQRDLASHPIFQALFALQETPLRDLGFGDVEDVSTDAAKFDVMLEIESHNAKLTYAKDLFDASTMERFAHHYVDLLCNVLTDPDRVPRMTPDIDTWNEPAVPVPAESLGELFERQARATPDRIAVVDGEASITYRELDERASAIAATLPRGTFVGVGTERSIAWIVEILAIIKAGSAYVPLDASYPEERLRFMREDAGVWTAPHPAFGHPLPADAGRGTMSPFSPPSGEKVPEGRMRGDSTAYLIYTSGSTGTPKGVAVPQSAIKRLVFNTSYVPFEEPQRIAQISNASFDAATFEIWGALLHGGTLFIIPREVILSATALAAELRRHRISALFITAALFNQHVREVPDFLATVDHALVGGEALDPNSIALCLAGGPPRRLLNGYGPTESTTFAAWHLIEHANGMSIPIGRPLTNTTLHVLDEHFVPQPIGVAGELCIGGDGLAHGYHRRPALTAERFIPNPFGAAGSRLYRTGDLARLRDDGTIEYLGRLDDQVKIRGFRIELGEIESVLRELVDDACVIVKDSRLIAYVVWTAATPVAALPAVGVRAATGVAAVQTLLRAKLPEYMIPSAFVTMDALPLNANGKVDRRALPEPGTGAPVDDAPSTETETRLASIWSEVLGIESVGTQRSFFDLGGHSLLAARVMSRIRVKLDADLPLSAIFERPTVRALAERIDAMRATLEEVEL